jgi:hypothetical protein
MSRKKTIKAERNKPIPKEKMIRQIKKKKNNIACGLIAIPKTKDAKSKGIKEMPRLTDDDIVLAKGNIYFGI